MTQLTKPQEYLLRRLRRGDYCYIHHDDPRCRVTTPGTIGASERIHTNTIMALARRGLVRILRSNDLATVYVHANHPDLEERDNP